MDIPLISVFDAGIAVRALRKRSNIRIDDFAKLAGVSKQFMTDLENGKPTVRMGMVLQMLQRLGIKVSMELERADALAYQLERGKVQERRSVSSEIAPGAVGMKKTPSA